MIPRKKRDAAYFLHVIHDITVLNRDTFKDSFEREEKRQQVIKLDNILQKYRRRISFLARGLMEGRQFKDLIHASKLIMSVHNLELAFQCYDLMIEEGMDAHAKTLLDAIVRANKKTKIPRD